MDLGKLIAEATRRQRQGVDLDAMLEEVNYEPQLLLMGDEPTPNGVSQRWKTRRDFYRSTRDQFRPTDWRVDLMSGTGAKDVASDFVVRNHYAATYPQTRLQVGLYRASDGLLAGVASFGNGPRGGAEKYGGVGKRELIELNRFILLPEVPGNAETWFLTRAIEIAGQVLDERGDQLKVVLSYSDPVPRRSSSGFLTMPGHVGNIYQARNAMYVGYSRSKSMHLDVRGVAPDPRMMAKIRSLDTDAPERGAVTGARRFVSEFGAPERRRGESHSDWVRRALASEAFRCIPHSGNLTYLWTFGDKRLKREIEKELPVRLPYPKTPRQLYLNLHRKYERAWSRGAVDQVSDLADKLLAVWTNLSDADRAGTQDPPQLGVTCGRRPGSLNSHVWTLDQIAQRMVC